jgi:hypothetical protein
MRTQEQAIAAIARGRPAPRPMRVASRASFTAEKDIRGLAPDGV